MKRLLRRKEIKYIYEENRKPLVGRVVGCNYDIGITIVTAEDPDEHLLCLQGPSVFKFDEDTPETIYQKDFWYVVSSIKKGIFDSEKYADFLSTYNDQWMDSCKDEVDSSFCAFNQ